MTKEEILNGMSEAEFYRLYPTKESWEAAQAEMAYGGSPYDPGIPFGAGITMAHGGTPYYGGPIYPAAYGGDIAEYCWGGLPGGPNEMPAMEDGGFYVGGNYNSPTNYGSFSVPMNQGGDLDIAQDGKIVDWAKQQQQKLAERTGQGVPTGVSKYYGAFDVPNLSQMDSVVTSPINPKIGMAFKGSKSMLVPLDRSVEQDVKKINKPFTVATPVKKGERDVYINYQEFGGAYDTTNQDTYPMMNTGGYGFIDDAISSVNATRKSGGDITSQGGNQDFLSQRNNYFLNYMQKMIDKNIRQEEAAKVKDAFIEMDSQLPPIGSTMAYGGVYQIGGPGISYRQSFDTVNPQNEAMIQAYQNMANTQQGNINKAWGNLYNSFYQNGGGPNKDESWEDYQKRLAEEKAGKEGGRGRVWDGTKWVPVNKPTDKNITYETTSPWANLAYGLNPEGQISKWIPDNDIRVGYRLGKKDFAEMAGLDPNIHKLSGAQFNYGPMGKLMPRVFGPKSITFGTMDMSKGAFEHLKEPLSFDNQTPGATRSYDDMNWFQKMKEDRRVAGQEKDAEKRRQRIAEIGPEAYKEEQAWNDMSWREKRASNKAMKQNLREDELRDKRLQELQNATGPVVKAYGGLPIAQTAPNPISYDEWAESLKFNPPSVAEEGPDEQFPPVETVGTKEQTEQEALADVAGIQKRRAEQEAMFGPAMGSKPDIMGGPGKQFTAKKKTTGVGKALAKRAHLVADIISSGLEAAQSNAKQKMQDMTLADNRFMTMSSSAKNRGDYDPNSGMFRPNQMVPVQFPGYTAQWGGFNTMEFGGLPMALSGLEVKMQPGLYGTNGNSQFNKSAHLEAGKISQKPTEVRNTLQPVAREGANLEAEKGETAVVNIDGMPAHFKIGGKRHSQGGTPLNLPDNSFIFSDTSKMKIKDPNVLAQFGMAPKKGGYTPAEIAKKYDLNKFRKILADPNTEDLERKTAEMMIANYNEKLAKLALAQESIKGFPQGIPVIAMPYIDAMQMDSSTFLPAQAEEQMEGENQPDADMGTARYGANVISQFPTKAYGGLIKAQDGNKPDIYSILDNMERNLLGSIQDQRSKGLPVQKSTLDAYTKYQELRKKYGPSPEKAVQEGTPMSWISSEGLPITDVSQGATGYLNRAGKMWGSGMSGTPYDIDPEMLNKIASGEIEIPKGGLEVPGIPKKKLTQLYRDVNPFDEYETKNTWDYTKKFFGAPLKLVNTAITGNVETPGTTYIRTHPGARVAPFLMDVTMDPWTWMGPGAIKAGVKGVMNLPKAYAWARYLIPEWGTALKEFALKYGPKAYDLLAKGIKKIGPAAEYLGPAAFNRLLSTDYGDIEKALRAGEDVDQKTIDKMIKEAVAKEKEKFKSQSEKGTSKSDTLSVLKPAKADTTKVAPADTTDWENVDWSNYKEK